MSNFRKLLTIIKRMLSKADPPKDLLDQPLLQLTSKDVFTMRDSHESRI